MPASDVEAGRRDGLVGPALEAAAVVHHLEESVGAIRDGLRQVDPGKKNMGWLKTGSEEMIS